jgi:hypothetical protein
MITKKIDFDLPFMVVNKTTSDEKCTNTNAIRKRKTLEK